MEVNYFHFSADECWATKQFGLSSDTQTFPSFPGEKNRNRSKRRKNQWAGGHQVPNSRHSYVPPLWNLFAAAGHTKSQTDTAKGDNFVVLIKHCSGASLSFNAAEDRLPLFVASEKERDRDPKNGLAFAGVSAPASSSTFLPFWVCAAARVPSFLLRRKVTDSYEPTVHPGQQCGSDSKTKSRAGSLSGAGCWNSSSGGLGHNFTRLFSSCTARQYGLSGRLSQSSTPPVCTGPVRLDPPLSTVRARAPRKSVNPTHPSPTTLRAQKPHTPAGSGSPPTRLLETIPPFPYLVHGKSTCSAFLRFLSDGKWSRSISEALFPAVKPPVIYRFRGFHPTQIVSGPASLSCAAPRSFTLFFLLFFLTGLPGPLCPITHRTPPSSSCFRFRPFPVSTEATAIQANAFLSPLAAAPSFTRSSAWGDRRNTRAFSSVSAQEFHTKRKRTEGKQDAMDSFLRPIQPKRSLFQVLQKGPLRVRMWVFEEMIEGEKLTDIINQRHENVKYLPGHKLPENLLAVPDVVEACRGADLLVFVMPHQFVAKVCDQLAKANVVPPHARAISLLKGLYVEGGRPQLFSDTIRSKLNIVECAALSGANVANDVAREEFAEATIGHSPDETDTALIWQQLFDKPYFKVNTLPDIAGVQLCGAVKNVVALAAGFCDGVGVGTNTKSAIIRLGVEEMKQFGMLFFDNVVAETFFDSAGYADVITTVFGGRNARCAAEFVRQKGNKSWDQIEAEMLNGQKLQGTLTTREVFEVISSHEVDHLFPLFTVTYDIAFKGRDPADLVRVFETSEVRPHKTPEECNILVLPPLMANAKRRIGRLQSMVDHERFKEEEKKIVKEYEKRYTEIEVAANTADDLAPSAPVAEECRERK
ncbi:cbr-GPDH-1 protein, related [Neospora caninum Liverpool]|uniref:Glycerol-3-phosphate dehydrogenase [NAD(+)] n=1 Tax=Neospora caninum (strain Liverpool) TaxID=572307 RepID=F0V7D6_NEOCL|nr:cbr-GPDH-1 protein, related [Neospora caninum Liverpool]CBZ49627.1 cbr-GPDH-1 protein, related [Neospora caninum Liverpool]|eukprot:XP_003879662.1 cbr-GPDH-1 protein, related [Neospora caninum Liverpool]